MLMILEAWGFWISSLYDIGWINQKPGSLGPVRHKDDAMDIEKLGDEQLTGQQLQKFDVFSPAQTGRSTEH